MDSPYDPLITVWGAYFAFTEDGSMLYVVCRACSQRFVYGTHGHPLQISGDMTFHLHDFHPILWDAIAPAPVSTPSEPPENPA